MTIINRTINVLTGKKSKFSSPLNVVVSIVLGSIVGIGVYYLSKEKMEDNKNREKISLMYGILSAFITMLFYNMVTREAGITL
jgi:phage gp36-like protein